jgi:hypothetical protein
VTGTTELSEHSIAPPWRFPITALAAFWGRGSSTAPGSALMRAFCPIPQVFFVTPPFPTWTILDIVGLARLGK